MISKKFMLMAIFLLSLLAVSAVSANEINTTDDVIAEEIAIDDTNQVELASDEEEDILGMEPIPELQNLVDNAKNGDIIELKKDYDIDFGYVNVNKSVTIDGNNHKINFKQAFRFYVYNSAVLKNIQIVGCGDSNNHVGSVESSVSDLTILNCKFINITNSRPVVSSSESNLVIDSCKFVDCGSNEYAQVYSSGSNLKVTNTDFINGNKFITEYKTNSRSGAPLSISGSDAFVSNCNFINNTGYLAGAIRVNGNKCHVKDCTFSGNNEIFTKSAINGSLIKSSECIYDIHGSFIEEIKYRTTAGAVKWDGNNGILENPILVNNDGYVDVNDMSGNLKTIQSHTKLEAPDVTKYYGGSEKYTVTLTNNGVAIADANVKISIDGKTQTVKTNSKGQASVDLNLAVGNHDVIAEYKNAIQTSRITVKSTITASDVTGIYSNSKVTATFLNTAGKALANTKVTFKIGTSSYSATTNSNGVASASIPLGVGTYTVTAVNPTNNEEKQFKLTISKASSTTSLTTVQNGKSVTLTAALTPSAATGKVTFEINGKTKEASISNGNASVTFSDLAPDTYTATATYNGDANFKSSTATASVKVNKVHSITNVGDVEGTYLDSKVRATFLDANGKTLANTKVTFKVGGKSYPATTNSRGVATASIDLDVGTYVVTAVNPDTKEEKQFRLTIINPNAKIVPLNLNGEYETFDIDAEYETGTFTFKLVDLSTNQPLPGKKLTLSILGEGIFGMGSVATDEYGIATFNNRNLNLEKIVGDKMYEYGSIDAGTYVFEVKGNDTSIIVSKIGYYATVGPKINIITNPFKEYEGSAKQFIINVTNAKTGEPMRGIVLHTSIKDTAYGDYYLQTDENGIAKIGLSALSSGNYQITISNNDTKNIVENKVYETITILDAPSKVNPVLSAESISLVYGNNKNLVVNVKDADGTPIADKDVYLNIFIGSNLYNLYSGQSDENGQLKFGAKGLKPNTYMVYINSDDCKEITAKITVKKATPKLTANAKTFKAKKTKKYTITLKTNKNKVMKKTKVTLIVNGKTYTAKTNNKGQATFTLTKLTKKGIYKAVVKFAGNSYYNKVSKTVKLSVK